MPGRDIRIINKLGLHARAAAKFVQTASKFESDITILSGDKEVNGKSIMGVMMLAAGKDSEIHIKTSGNDENEALTAIETLIGQRFGEAE